VPESSTIVSGPAMTPDPSPPLGPPAAPVTRDAGVLELFVLGPPDLRHGEQVVHFRTRKAFALLAYLSLSLTRIPHSRERLASVLWPDHDEAAARVLLRTTLSQLRHQLAAAGGVALEAITLLHTDHPPRRRPLGR
jgi:hypothetical protein